jgi:methylmalonyl-CoA/ethylmalonyl-CoA epimerase
MNTVVVQRGNAKIALMQGHDKLVKSQINDFIEKYGQGVQHVAIEV